MPYAVLHCMQNDSKQITSRGLFGVFQNNKRCSAEEPHLLVLHFMANVHTSRHVCIWSIVLLAAGLPQ